MNLDPEFLDTLSKEELNEMFSEAQQALWAATDACGVIQAQMGKRERVETIQQIMSNFSPEEIAMAKKLAQSASVDGIESQSGTGWA